MKKTNNHKKKKKSIEVESKFSLFEVIIIILISVIFGVIIGYLITYGNSNLSRVRSDTHLGEIVSTYNNIVDNYYDEINKDDLTESAIKGMISALNDPYSAYLDEDSTSTFNESVDGEYVGIGITTLFIGEYNQIVSVLENGPAAKVGLQEGDIILKVNNKDCHNVYSQELNEMITGKIGTSVKIKILRGEEEFTYSIKRQVIEIKNVTGKVIDDTKIGYIKINIFSSNSYDQFVETIDDLEKKKIDSLIIDIRDNPGGHLSQAKKILDWFFNKKTILYQTEVNGSKKKVYAENNDTKKYPVILLINHETASSAEVVAACFKDNYKDIHLVGSNTYGKGNVQKSVSLNSGTSIKFTIEKWLTPKGKSVSDVGVTPDTPVEQSEEYYNFATEENDLVLQEAINILK